MRLISLRALFAAVAALGLPPHGVSALITLGALEPPGYVRDVEVVGDLAYVVDYDSAIDLDISPGSKPNLSAGAGEGFLSWPIPG